MATGQLEHRQFFPRPGWVEHDPMEIWRNTREVIGLALGQAGITRHELAGVGITNQRETTVVWDRRTGRPVHPAIVWQDTRTQEIADQLAADGGTHRFAAKTGVPLSAYFSATKIAWILEHVEGARAAAERGELAFGTTDSWLIWNLTGGPDGGVHVTDVNTGETPVTSRNGLITTVAYRLGDEAPRYALEGSIAVTGSLIQWLRDNLGIIGAASEIEPLARTVEDTGGAYIVPAFSGLFAPYWRPDARGAILGLTSYSTKAHLARAALESIAYQTRDVLQAVTEDFGRPLTELRVDGGATANDLLMQFQADVLGIDVVRPRVTETTALGAAFAAGLAVGTWSGLDELRANWAEETRFSPNMGAERREGLLAGWAKAVDKSLGWVDGPALP